MTSIRSIRLPIDWTAFGWPREVAFGGVACSTGDPAWGWEPAAPAFPIEILDATASEATSAERFAVDHVVLLVPDLERAISTLGRSGIPPRLRMAVRGRPAAFFRVGPVLEVIESPVRSAAIYGIALATELPLATLAQSWRDEGVDVGDPRDAIQPGRRIMTVHGLDAGFAVMSADGAASDA